MYFPHEFPLYMTILFSTAGFILYILLAIGLYTLSSKNDVKYAWIAWVPIANMYTLAALIESIYIGNWQISDLELFLPLGMAVSILLFRIPIIGLIIAGIYTILIYLSIYKLYYIYKFQKRKIMIILSIIPIMIPIIIFSIRKNLRLTLV